MSFITAFKARTWSAVKVATSRLTPADTHTSSTPAYPQYMESSPDSGSVLLGSTLCLFIHMLIGFYKKQWTDRSYDGTSYNPATTYPGHTLSLLLPFTPPLLSYLHFEGLVLRRVADSDHCPLVFNCHGNVALDNVVSRLFIVCAFSGSQE